MRIRPFSCRAEQRGVALLLVMLIVLITGIGIILSRTNESSSPVSRDPITQNALETARQALIGYAATYRDKHAGEMFGYLPCPDTNNDGEAEASCPSAGEVVFGRLPYKTLGIPVQLDTAGECLWYAVGNFKNNPKSDTLSPAQAMNWDTPGHFTVRDLDNRDLATPAQHDGGAAAIVLAPGPALAGQTRTGSSGGNPCTGGTATVDTATLAAYQEGGYSAVSAASLSAPLVVVTGRPGSATNNDRIAWITPAEIFTRRVKLRSGFQDDINAMLNSVQARLQSDFPSPVQIPSSPASNVNAGRVPDTYLSATLPSGNYDANFSDNLFFAKCSTATKCFTLKDSGSGATTPCQGVLAFAGERTTSQRRSTTDEKNAVANYLENSVLLPLFQPGATMPATADFTAPTKFRASKADELASTDILRCLVPNLSLAESINDIVTIQPPTAPLAKTDTTDKTLTLGLDDPSGIAGGELYGCAWFPEARWFGNGLRAYFAADFQLVGEGITLTIADATTNADTARCGASGQSLGYSGQGVQATSAINAPKIALELDTAKNNGYDESASPTGRGDDSLAQNPHAAFVYWGNSLANGGQSVAQPTWDDNVHGKGGALSATGKLEPTNPTAAATHKKLKGTGTGGADKYVVRIDIKRSRDSLNAKSTYTLQAWVFALGGEACYATAVGAGISDISDDFENMIFWSSSCKTPITDTVTIFDETANEAFQTFRVAFTTGQTTAGQRVVISDFKLGARP